MRRARRPLSAATPPDTMTTTITPRIATAILELAFPKILEGLPDEMRRMVVDDIHDLTESLGEGYALQPADRSPLAYAINERVLHAKRSISAEDLTGEPDHGARAQVQLLREIAAALDLHVPALHDPRAGNPTLQCPSCGHTWQSRTADGSDSCPECS